MPGPSKGCLLNAFKYLKTTKRYPLEGASVFFLFNLKSIHVRTPGREARKERMAKAAAAKAAGAPGAKVAAAPVADVVTCALDVKKRLGKS